MLNECVRDFKKGTKEKNYKDYFNSLYYLRGFLVFVEKEDV